MDTPDILYTLASIVSTILYMHLCFVTYSVQQYSLDDLCTPNTIGITFFMYIHMLTYSCTPAAFNMDYSVKTSPFGDLFSIRKSLWLSIVPNCVKYYNQWILVYEIGQHIEASLENTSSYGSRCIELLTI